MQQLITWFLNDVMKEEVAATGWSTRIREIRWQESQPERIPTRVPEDTVR